MNDDEPHSEPRPWIRHDREEGPDLLIARARFDTMENPRTGRRMRRTVLESPDWVNVVAVTPERRLVLVRQYRFGSAGVTTEIPGGVVDRGEAHGEAARRELAEETGYTSERWSYLGFVEPNPAFLENRCHHWLAEEALRTEETDLDPGEDIVVTTIELGRVPEEIASGRILHSLVICALSRVLDLHRAR
jgi:ADP-ribose pyrophosphatase